MAACHAETTISLEMDSELEESCMNSLWSLSTGLIYAHFLCFRGKNYRVARSTQCTIICFIEGFYYLI